MPPASADGLTDGAGLALSGRLASRRSQPCGVDSPVGDPEAPNVGVSRSEGAKPPSAGAGAAGAPKLDTYESSQLRGPSRVPLFRPVRLTLGEFRRRVAVELHALSKTYFRPGKKRRGFKRAALSLVSCGSTATRDVCPECGRASMLTISIDTSCGLRCCPMCARRRANNLRARLDRKWCEGRRPRDMGLYLLTFTLRYDPGSPDDLSVEGLKRRRKLVRDAVGFVWKRYLKPRGLSLALAVEVSPRGAVHVHALYHGHRPDARQLRSAYMFQVGDSPVVNCKYVRNPAKGIREVVKYLGKAASPRNPRIIRGGVGDFINPVLAARAEVAFSGARLFECLGAWRGADVDEDAPEREPHACPHCGGTKWQRETVLFRSLLPALPYDWVPRFGRVGPQSKTKRTRGEVP